MTVLDFVKTALAPTPGMPSPSGAGSSLPKSVPKQPLKPIKPAKAVKPITIQPQANPNRLNVTGFSQAPMARASTAPAQGLNAGNAAGAK